MSNSGEGLRAVQDSRLSRLQGGWEGADLETGLGFQLLVEKGAFGFKFFLNFSYSQQPRKM